MTIHETLMADFPVRKTREQKERFRTFALGRAKEAGWNAAVEKKGMHRNVVIGDPEQASVVFTAHYDTPANMVVPNFCAPCNLWIYILYTAGISLFMVGLSLLAFLGVRVLTGDERLAILAYFAVLIGVTVLMLMGPANKHNANDNTSGTAAVLALMAAIPPEHRAKAAFILFDNEEKGMLGSGAYAKAHPAVRDGKPVINMDCVGVGKEMLLIARPDAKDTPVYALAERILGETPGCIFSAHSSHNARASSDYKSFKQGMNLMAFKRGPRIGLYCTDIHTAADTICSQTNLDYLQTALLRLVAEI